MTSLGSLEIDVEVKLKGAIDGLNKLTSSLDKLDKTLDKVDKTVQKLNKTTEGLAKVTDKASKSIDKENEANKKKSNILLKLGATLSSLSVIYDTAAGAAMKFFKMSAKAGGQIDAANFFKKSGRDIKDFTKEVNGIVSDADMVKNVNLANTMGIDDNQFKTLSKVAQAASIKFGEPFERMLSSITLGSARGSKLLLDNLGIIVDTEKAYKALFNQLKESGQIDQKMKFSEFREAMTDSAKKLAIMNEAVRIGSKDLAAMGDLSDSVGGRVQKGMSDIENAWDHFAQTVTNATFSADSGLNKFLENSADNITRWVQHIIGQSNEAKGGLENIAKMVGVGGVFAAAGGAMAAGLGGGALVAGAGAAIVGALGLTAYAGKKGNEAIDQADKDYEADKDTFNKLEKRVSELNAHLKVWTNAVDDQQSSAVEDISLEQDRRKWLELAADKGNDFTAKAFSQEIIDRLYAAGVDSKTAEDTAPSTEKLMNDFLNTQLSKGIIEALKRQPQQKKKLDVNTLIDQDKGKDKTDRLESKGKNAIEKAYDKLSKFNEDLTKLEGIYSTNIEKEHKLDELKQKGKRAIPPGPKLKALMEKAKAENIADEARARAAQAIGIDPGKLNTKLYTMIQDFRDKVLSGEFKQEDIEKFSEDFEKELLRVEKPLELATGVGEQTGKTIDEQIKAEEEQQIKDLSFYLSNVNSNLQNFATALSGAEGLLSVVFTKLTENVLNNEQFMKESGFAEMVDPLISQVPELANLKGDTVGLIVEIIMMLVSKITPLMDALQWIFDGLGRALDLLLGGTLSELLRELGESIGRLLVVIGYLIGGLVDIITSVLGTGLISGVVSVLVDMITAAVVVITGFLRAGAAIVGWGNSFGEALASAGDWMLKAAIDWINGIITAANVVNDWLFSWVPKEIRDTLGLGQAGDMELIDYNDFIFRNTEATEENTKAVRDLQQELKNLPSGFRTSFYQYQSQAPRQNTSMVSGNNGAAYSEDISLIPDQRY